MTLVGVIDERKRRDRRFDAALHGRELADDGVSATRPHNASHAAMERMKARRRARGER